MDPIKLQQDLRNNQEDIQGYMRDLRNWTDQIKKKDKKLKSEAKTRKSSESAQGRDKEDSKTLGTTKGLSTAEGTESHRRKMVKKYDPSEEVLKLKEAGNECLKNNEYEEAIKHYSAAIKLDSNYHILPANRGMAYLKLNSFEKAEEDCGRAVELDPKYIKGYLRRGTARLEQGKFLLAREDYQQVLKLEPHNPQAKMSLERIKLEVAKQSRLDAAKAKSEMSASSDASTKLPHNTAAPLHMTEKPAHLRSKKPLKKITVMEVRNDDELESFLKRDIASRLEKVPESNGNVKQRLTPLRKDEVQEKVTRSKEAKNLPLESEKECDTNGETSRLGEEKQASPRASHPARGVLSSPVALPAAPRSSYEFVRDWKLLRAGGALRGQYLRQIPPGDYAAIFKQLLEESTLVEVLRVAETLPAAEVADHLRGLSRVQRVDVLVMFMGDEDRRLLLSLVEQCEADGQDMADVRRRVGV